MKKTFYKQGTTIRISKEMTNELREIRDKNNLRTLNEALMIYTNEKIEQKTEKLAKAIKGIKAIKESQEKTMSWFERQKFDMGFNQGIAQIYIGKHPDQVRKDFPLILKLIQKLASQCPVRAKEIAKQLQKQGLFSKITTKKKAK